MTIFIEAPIIIAVKYFAWSLNHICMFIKLDLVGQVSSNMTWILGIQKPSLKNVGQFFSKNKNVNASDMENVGIN